MKKVYSRKDFEKTFKEYMMKDECFIVFKDYGEYYFCKLDDNFEKYCTFHYWVTPKTREVKSSYGAGSCWSKSKYSVDDLLEVL